LTGLVSEEAVRSAHDLLLEFAAIRLAHQYGADFGLGFGHALSLVEIARGPGGDHVRHIDGVALLAQQMIGAGKRDEAFRTLGGGEDMRGILDANDVVGGRVKDQQRLAQIGETVLQLSLGHVVEDFALDAERPARERHLDFALRADHVDVLLEQAGDVGRIARSRNGDYGARVGDFVCGGEHGAAAQAVPDQDRGRSPRLTQMIGGGHQVVDVR
jgi:hypothetical protein